MPTARHKLTSAHLVVAGVLGFITRSPTVFVLAAGTLIGLSIHSGEIRFKGRP